LFGWCVCVLCLWLWVLGFKIESIDTWFYFSSFLKWRCFAGLAFPQLYFYNGGVKEFLATIKQHVFIVRLATDLVCNSFYFEILFLDLFLSIYKYLHYKDAYLDIIRAKSNILKLHLFMLHMGNILHLELTTDFIF
jgi:hypothetical protein